MSLKAVFFDLDGTLLPMDQEVFIKTYFKSIAMRMVPFGYNPDELISAIWKGTGAMIKNDGSQTNEQAFWQAFASVLGEESLKDTPHFDKFYEEEFDDIRSVCGFNPKAAETVHALKSKGLRLVLATNPIFPSIATEKRTRWAGLDVSDFELYTSYENISFSKPNLKYYQTILSKTGLNPEECLMVGNDVGDDMVAESLGLKVFLLTDCLINKDDTDISVYPHGSFDDLNDYIGTLI